MNDAVITAEGQLNGRPVVCCAMEFDLSAARWARWWAKKLRAESNWRIETRQPLIVISCSGGARMMEGTISLMQLAKVSAALAKLDDAKVPYISVLDRSDHRRRDR